VFSCLCGFRGRNSAMFGRIPEVLAPERSVVRFTRAYRRSERGRKSTELAHVPLGTCITGYRETYGKGNVPLDERSRTVS
jgi:hypothetical protein